MTDWVSRPDQREESRPERLWGKLDQKSKARA